MNEQKKIYEIKDSGCWEKIGNSKGYSMVRLHGKPVSFHRVAYTAHFGKIPKGMYVCHKCDNPKCINPDHLFLGAPRDNVLDSVKKGRRKNLPIGRRSEKGRINDKPNSDLFGRIVSKKKISVSIDKEILKEVLKITKNVSGFLNESAKEKLGR